MRRFIVHAGFDKTGSSSIQTALVENRAKLADQSVYSFNRGMQVRHDDTDPVFPMWHFERLAAQPLEASEFIPKLFEEAATVPDDATLVLSAENLSQPKMAPLFGGLDDRVPVDVIVYMRPQFEWLPSAWKQWSVKQGNSLADVVAYGIDQHYPDNFAALSAWHAALPNARITVRPFFPDVLYMSSPVRDFMRFAGIETAEMQHLDAHVNAGVDYSLLHVVRTEYKRFFRNIFENTLDEIESLIPNGLSLPRIPLLSMQSKQAIEAAFREDNIEILTRFAGDLPGGVDQFYQDHFVPKPTGKSYQEQDEREVLLRCFEILLNAKGEAWAQDVLLRRIDDLVPDRPAASPAEPKQGTQ